jgi:3-dehydroquinate synthase
MHELTVTLAERSYPIRIAAGLLSADAMLDQFCAGASLLVTDDNVGPLYAGTLKAAIGRPACPVWQMPAGEREKNLSRFCELLDAMAAHRLTRDSTVLALGGGVIGDLAGFASACYMRGIAFIQIPTSLLAMVDSSVGGKTAVDLAAGKNLAGAFHQPKAVWIDTEVLKTLPEREYRAGLAEVVKYAALGDPGFFSWLERHADALIAKESGVLASAIARCCAQKAGIVGRDETEQGERALLNFGHTFGHALEVLLGFGGLVHGEAVAVGMQLAADFSAMQGLAPAADAVRLRTLLQAFGLPVAVPPGLRATDMMEKMRLDKKALHGRLRLILWHGIGQAFIDANIDADGLQAFLQSRCHTD